MNTRKLLADITETEIVEKAQPIGSLASPTIYYLVKGSRVVYVGQSEKNVMARIAHHLADPNKDFDSFTIFSVPYEELDAIETDQILRFNPRYNKSIPYFNSVYALKGRLKTLYNCDAWAINRFIKENNIRSYPLNKRTYYAIADFKGLAK